MKRSRDLIDPAALKKKNLSQHFFEKTRDAKRVLVLDLGFLGDTIHLIPALWMIRQAYPEAKMHVMIADHVKALLDLTPWVDEVLGYPRYPKGPKWYQDWGRLRDLRAKRYDVVINLNGSDRSSFLTAMTGAPARLGRVPEDGGPFFWEWLFTDVVACPDRGVPVYRQSCEILQASGFPASDPQFPITLKPADVARVKEMLGTEDAYLQVSPFANDDFKEMPVELLAEALRIWRERCVGVKLVLSCAPTERERAKMSALAGVLGFEPWRIFDGKLSITEFAALIHGASLHASGDSGSLHVAFMCGTRTVSWFRKYEGMHEWMPTGAGHAALVGMATPTGLSGISAQALADALIAHTQGAEL